ncbi:MAG: hypothetical protein K0S56_925 [Microvirga sp.]|jgi:hypothetical protein|nr:hypothetical protein [Microvirga sp.]
MDRAEIRKQVLAQIIAVMADADEQGRDTVEAAKAAFPGTPEDVIWSAWVEFDNAKTEAWWQQVERTIDGEIIRRALSSRGEGGAS